MKGSDPRDLEVRRLEAEESMRKFDAACAGFGHAMADTLCELNRTEAKILQEMKRENYILGAIWAIFALVWVFSLFRLLL